MNDIIGTANHGPLFADPAPVASVTMPGAALALRVTRPPTGPKDESWFAARFTRDDPRIEIMVESGCWIWMGPLNRGGYGKTTVSRRGYVSAHRAFWTKATGTAPPRDMYLDHICRERSCVNPDHLRLVTPRTNVLENSLSASALNVAKECCGVCGGPYKQSTTQRYCAACKNASNRIRRNPEIHVPGASQAAREAIAPHLSKLQTRVLTALVVYGPCTRDRLCEVLGMNPNTLRPRIVELLDRNRIVVVGYASSPRRELLAVAPTPEPETDR